MQRAVIHLRHADPVLRAIIDGVGPCWIRCAEPDFETLARSVVFQQLSGASARAIFDRLKRSAARDGRMAPADVLALPTPARVEMLARDWHPHCSVACWYLWRSLDVVLPIGRSVLSPRPRRSIAGRRAGDG